MEKETLNRIVLNFSAENIMGYKEKVSGNGKPYRLVIIRIPDENPIDDGSKRVVEIPEWLIRTDKDNENRRYCYLEIGKMMKIYVARGLNETFSVDEELYHLSLVEDIVELFKKYDRKHSFNRRYDLFKSEKTAKGEE